MYGWPVADDAFAFLVGIARCRVRIGEVPRPRLGQHRVVRAVGPALEVLGVVAHILFRERPLYGRRQVPFHRSGRYGLLRKRDLLGKGCIALGRRDRKLAEAAEREVLLKRLDRYLHVGVGGTLPGAHLVPCRSARWGDRPGIGGVDREFHLGTRFCGVVAELQRIVR